MSLLYPDLLLVYHLISPGGAYVICAKEIRSGSLCILLISSLSSFQTLGCEMLQVRCDRFQAVHLLLPCCWSGWSETATVHIWNRLCAHTAAHQHMQQRPGQHLRTILHRHNSGMLPHLNPSSNVYFTGIPPATQQSVRPAQHTQQADCDWPRSADRAWMPR